MNQIVLLLIKLFGYFVYFSDILLDY